MRVNLSQPTKNDFIKLQHPKDLEDFRFAGKVLATTMSLLLDLVKNKKQISLLEYSKIAEESILHHNCTPTFKGYKGFPESVCISVNQQLVHGIPTDYIPQEGDLITFDFGVTYKDGIADSATTTIFGEPKDIRHVKLIDATKDALKKGIAAVGVGKKIGCIGDAIYKSAKNDDFNVVTEYGGHGVPGKNVPHSSPFISNKSSKDEGVRIQPGMVLAIEPLLILHNKRYKTWVDVDGWTVYTDSDLSAHEEHTIYLHENNEVEILTYRDQSC